MWSERTPILTYTTRYQYTYLDGRTERRLRRRPREARADSL